jgi:hypothetical protein
MDMTLVEWRIWWLEPPLDPAFASHMEGRLMNECNEAPKPTYGEIAVGLTFNPGSNPDVEKIKRAFASQIDGMDGLRKTAAAADKYEQARLASVAITEMQAAQMWAVKAVTFNG